MHIYKDINSMRHSINILIIVPINMPFNTLLNNMEASYKLKKEVVK